MKANLSSYDDFRSPTLDPSKWATSRLPLGENRFWDYYDPNTRVTTGDGRCEVTVNPFSRTSNQLQIMDNPKTLFGSPTPFTVRENETITVAAKVGAIAHGVDLDDIWDGFVTFNLFDFESGVVLDFLLNGKLVFALFERLYMPGITDEKTAFTREANLPLFSEPGKMHECVMTYDRRSDTAEWSIDGQLMFRAPNLPVKVNQFILGMGLMTIKPISSPFPYYFPRSTSLHGQGMTGIWSDIRVGKKSEG
jgi:hypothetical protein